MVQHHADTHPGRTLINNTVASLFCLYSHPCRLCCRVCAHWLSERAHAPWSLLMDALQ